VSSERRLKRDAAPSGPDCECDKPAPSERRRTFHWTREAGSHWAEPSRTAESTITSQQEYRITGDSISVGCFKPCPAKAQCAANLVGELTGSSLTLTYATNPLAPHYLYRLAPSLWANSVFLGVERYDSR
jgi:hypothetical protein